MLARRSPKVLHAILRAAALPADASASAKLGLVSVQGLPSSLVTVWRSFGTSFWDVPTSARQELFIEMMSIRSLLPNRSPFTPHFTPHGVMLMPNSGSMQLTQQQQHQAVADEEAAAGEATEEEQGMWADSVKRKRKLKMKKHKLKKRRKLTRHQQ
jgi:hypothetical protein